MAKKNFTGVVYSTDPDFQYHENYCSRNHQRCRLNSKILKFISDCKGGGKV